MDDEIDTTLSSNQPACTICREKKIRCGREVPQCASCRREGLNCRYSNPSKRVNHIKLLCNNVGGLEDRLTNIEDKLSHLTTSLLAPRSRRSSKDSQEEGPLSDNPKDQQLGNLESPSLPRRHIVRDDADLLHRYHGPCTLFALCTEFCESALSDHPPGSPPRKNSQSQHGTKEYSSAQIQALKETLTLMCTEVSAEETFDLRSEQSHIRLPPRRFLLMVQAQFFKQADYIMDIFVPSRFWCNVEHIYSRGLGPGDEAWAICLNTIIILVTRSEIASSNTEPAIRAQFARSLFQTVHAALSNPRLLTAPKLINIQALVLLSVVAQQYYSAAVTEAIFAQACVLARSMGLHQNQAAANNISLEEQQERFKVFRSLYLRDRSFAISRGSICWLPSFDCTLSPELSTSIAASASGSTTPTTAASTDWVARIQLARLQEDIYKQLHGSESYQSTSKHRSALSNIRKRLDQWAKSCNVFAPIGPETRNLELRLEFLSASIITFRGSSEPGQNSQLLRDARASCLLLLIARGKHDQSMLDKLESLSLPRGPPESSTKPTKSRPGVALIEGDCPEEFGPPASQNLLDAFSVSAFFILVKNLLWPQTAVETTQEKEDINLLQLVCGCYEESDANVQPNNYIRKVTYVFKRLIDVVYLLRNSDQNQMSMDMMNRNTNNRTLSQNIFGGPQDLPDYSSTPQSFAIPTPQNWEFINPDSSSKSPPETLNAASSAQFTKYLESELYGKNFEPIQLNSFDTTLSPQSDSPGNKKRARLHKSDNFPVSNYQDSHSQFSWEQYMMGLDFTKPMV